MLKTIVRFGVIAGLVVGTLMYATTSAMHPNPPSLSVGMILGYTSMLIALSAIFVAIKRHRDLECGGVIRFWPAFGMGLGITVIAGVIYVLAWELTLRATGLDYANGFAEMWLADQKAKGVSQEALAVMAQQMEEFKTQYANPLYRLPMTFTEIFPVGVLVSAISAGLLRNSRFLPAPQLPAERVSN